MLFLVPQEAHPTVSTQGSTLHSESQIKIVISVDVVLLHSFFWWWWFSYQVVSVSLQHHGL